MESTPGDWKGWDPHKQEVVCNFRSGKPLPLGWEGIKESDGHIYGIMNRLPQFSHLREQVEIQKSWGEGFEEQLKVLKELLRGIPSFIYSLNETLLSVYMHQAQWQELGFQKLISQTCFYHPGPVLQVFNMCSHTRHCLEGPHDQFNGLLVTVEIHNNF